MEFKALQREPVEGFLVTIPDDSDFYTWQVAIFGPPDTPYAGGYFKVGSVCLPMCGSVYMYTVYVFYRVGRDEVSDGLPLLPTKATIPHTNPSSKCLHRKL